jgi:hypothetical protein
MNLKFMYLCKTFTAFKAALFILFFLSQLMVIVNKGNAVVQQVEVLRYKPERCVSNPVGVTGIFR